MQSDQSNKFPSSAGVIFDLDGTLIDTADDLAAAMNYVLGLHNIEPLPTEKVRHLVGFGAKAMIRGGFDEAMGKDVDEAFVERLSKQFVDYYADHIAVHSKPFDGTIEMLEVLRDVGVRLSVCTNKKEQLARPLLEALNLTDYFDVIVGGDTAGAAKPDRAPVLLCLDAMKIAHQDAGLHTLFIGDSDTDIRAAKAAGIPVIICDFGYGPLDLCGQADALLDSYDHAPALILSMFEQRHAKARERDWRITS